MSWKDQDYEDHGAITEADLGGHPQCTPPLSQQTTFQKG